MQTTHHISRRPGDPTTGGRAMIRHVFTLALLVALAAPGAALAADEADILGEDRGISVVPLDQPEASGEAAEIAELAGAFEADAAEAVEAPEAVAAPEAATEAVEAEETVEATDFALAGIESAADLYERLLRAGYDVAITGRDHFGRYAFLVAPERAGDALLLIVDGGTGKVLSHRTVDAGHGYATGGHAAIYRPAGNPSCRGDDGYTTTAGYRGGRLYASY